MGWPVYCPCTKSDPLANKVLCGWVITPLGRQTHHRLRRSLVFYFFLVCWPAIFPSSLYLAVRGFLLRIRPADISALLFLNNMQDTSLLAGLLYPDPFFVSTPPYLPCLLYSQSRYSPRTLAVALLCVYSLVALLTTSSLITFATESSPYPGSSLMLGVRYAILGTLYTDA